MPQMQQYRLVCIKHFLIRFSLSMKSDRVRLIGRLTWLWWIKQIDRGVAALMIWFAAVWLFAPWLQGRANIFDFPLNRFRWMFTHNRVFVKPDALTWFLCEHDLFRNCFYSKSFWLIFNYQYQRPFSVVGWKNRNHFLLIFIKFCQCSAFCSIDKILSWYKYWEFFFIYLFLVFRNRSKCFFENSYCWLMCLRKKKSKKSHFSRLKCVELLTYSAGHLTSC